MRTLASVLLAATLLSTGACADLDASDPLELAEPGDDGDGGKADQADIPLSRVTFGAPRNAETERVGVIKSAAAWRQVFGVDPPPSIDFASEWAAFYTAGAQRSGGYEARITRVRLSETGKSLKVATVLDSPGADCVVTLAITTPYAIVKFARPAIAPTTNRYTSETKVTSCSADQDCTNGTVVWEPGLVESATDGFECEVPITHCLTNDHSACPQVSPLPPGFCADGRIETTPNYVPSADGMECSIPKVHCLTNDLSACPQLSPLPPGYCADGYVVSEPTYVSSADGKECRIPSVHCASDDEAICGER